MAKQTSLLDQLRAEYNKSKARTDALENAIIELEVLEPKKAIAPKPPKKQKSYSTPVSQRKTKKKRKHNPSKEPYGAIRARIKAFTMDLLGTLTEPISVADMTRKAREAQIITPDYKDQAAYSQLKIILTNAVANGDVIKNADAKFYIPKGEQLTP